jgi:transcription elongation factor GreB
VRYLRKRLDEVKPVPARSDNPGKVFFGATVTLAESGGAEVVYRIVGADETDAERGWISVDSPVARALLGRSLEEEVSVHTPTGERLLEVVEVCYGDA